VLVQRVGTVAVVVSLRKFILSSDTADLSSGAQAGTLQEAYDLDLVSSPVKITTDSGQGDVDITGTEGLVVSAEKGLNVTGGTTQTTSITTETTSQSTSTVGVSAPTAYGVSAAGARRAQKFLNTVTGNIKNVVVPFTQSEPNGTYLVTLLEEPEISSGVPVEASIIDVSAVLTIQTTNFFDYEDQTFVFLNSAKIIAGKHYYLLFEEVTDPDNFSVGNIKGTSDSSYYEDGYMLDESPLWSFAPYNSTLEFTINVTNTVESTNIQIHGATSGTVEVQAKPVTTDYRMLLPDSQGQEGQSMVNDGSGVLQWENNHLTTIQVDLLDNQPTPVNVDSFSVNSLVDKGFSADIVLSRSNAITPTINTTWQTEVNGFNIPSGSIVAMHPDGSAIVGLPAEDLGTPPRQLIKISPDGTDDDVFRQNFNDVSGFQLTPAIDSIVIEHDGNILVGGKFFYAGIYNIIRVSPSGILDTTFDSGAIGKWSGQLGSSGNDRVRKILLQENGDIMLVGSNATTTSSPINGIAPATSRTALVRITPTAELDTEFEENFFAAQHDSTQTSQLDARPAVYGEQVVVFLNGDIVAVAREYLGTNISLRRYDKFGREDRVFKTTVGPINTGINKIIAQRDGSMIVAGSLTTFNGSPVQRILKLDSNGVEDPVYKATIGTGFDNTVNDIIRQPDGRLIVVGNFTDFNGTPVTGIIRLNQDGTIDTTFPTHSFDTVPLSSAVPGPDGQILVYGTFSTVDTVAATNLVLLSPDPTYSKQYTLRGFFDHTNQQWNIGENTFIGEDVGVDLTMTDEGQLQYTSTNLGGSQIINFIRFLLRKL